MILFFSVWLLLVLVLSFWKLKWGVVLFLMYMVLVPYMKLQFGGFELGQNLFNTAFMASYFIYASKNKVKTDWRPLMPFIVYYIAFTEMTSNTIENYWLYLSSGLFAFSFLENSFSLEPP